MTAVEPGVADTADRSILCVDDEPKVLEGLQRVLGRRYRVATAVGGAAGLDVIRDSGPFAVVVSDMQMPAMSGAEFLGRVRELCPSAVRVLLTGQSSMQHAIEAVNRGAIFRFLTKPCPPADMVAAMDAACEQHRLMRAEQDLLENTLKGAVEVLVEALGLVNPVAFGRAQRLRRYVGHMCSELALSGAWRFEVAALFSLIGCITLPSEVMEKVEARQALSLEEQRLWDDHPEVAHRLLSRIPRLDQVADIVRHLASPSPAGLDPDVQRGVALLRLAIEYDALLSQGDSAVAVLGRLRKAGHPDHLVAALSNLPAASTADAVVRAITVRDLALNMTLDQDVLATNGLLLAAKGTEVKVGLIRTLQLMASQGRVVQPFRVVLRR
jgi:response regulator RpfG family c-di-GMP phosphodiesterase